MTFTQALMPAAIACALFAGSAMAVELEPVAAYSDNTVTFLGQVTDQTCQITINGQAVKPVVLLPTVPVESFDADRARAGDTEFVVAVSGCPINDPPPTRALVNGKRISTTFVAHETIDGNLLNVIPEASGGAKNVHINIIDTRNYDIDFATPFHGEGDLRLKGGDSTTATATYTAQYIAHGEPSELGAGYVRASMQYALSYD
ncbi:type 1 fimbrial protein [Shimwellia pseudoproteus]|uniref:fimbrial protein n=1 Tax=Shimwellia pseudoproteus TaxID=570012 RepID=UPI0018ECA78E|nr:fimbrial protein [Shimwellia pseudoproteus]MBJ3815377.1 type 1 fimbrial protein [Shimwellia pseudoproteus]